MVLKPTRVTINGNAARRCASWISQFVEFTEDIEAPAIFRKWIAIGTIAAALEQKVWIKTSDFLYPNLYTALIAAPGVGKTRTIMRGRAFLSELEGLHLSPTDMTAASLVDAVMSCKRQYTQHYPPVPNPVEEFYSMSMLIDEWGTLLKAYDGDIIPLLTSFYDVNVPFEQWRRGGEVRIKIPRPQLNILAGATPSTLMRYMPDSAWDQGFTSRLIMIYSAEKNTLDDFDEHVNELPADMRTDIQSIFQLYGEFKVDPSFREAVNKWRDPKGNNENPKPTHPKLVHYNTRRRAHLYKLAIISAVDRGSHYLLDRHDFDVARGWLEEAEVFMPDVFAAGALSVDGRVMDEIEEFVARQDKPVTEHRILRFASDKLPAYSIVGVLRIMVASQRLVRVSDKPVSYRVGPV